MSCNKTGLAQLNLRLPSSRMAAQRPVLRMRLYVSPNRAISAVIVRVLVRSFPTAMYAYTSYAR